MSESTTGVTRRSVLKRALVRTVVLAGVGGLSGALAACGASDPEGAAPTSQVTAADVAAASGEVDVLTFSFFQVDALSDGKVKPRFTDVVTSSDILAKVKSSSTELGVIDNGQNTMNELYALDALVPIPTDLLSNYAALEANLVQDPTLAKDGKVYAVPFSVATLLTAWDSKKVDEPKTADQLLDTQYRGSIALTDTADMLWAVHAALGGDMSGMTHDDLDKVVEYLDRLPPNIKVFASSAQIPELFGRGDISVAFQTYGVYVPSIQEATPTVKANFLGAISYADCWTISKKADAAKALSWIDNAIGEKAQKETVAASGGLPTLASAADPAKVPDVMKDLSISEVLKRGPLIPSLAAEPDGDLVTRTEFEEAWTSFKGSF